MESGGNPGIIGTLLRMENGPQKHDETLSELNYQVFLYKTKEATKGKTEEGRGENVVMSEYLFAHEKDGSTRHEVEDVKAEDLVDLLKLLKVQRR